MPEDCSVELRTNACHSLLTATENGGIGELMECKQYSKLQKLLRVTALVKKFAAQFKVIVKHNTIAVDFTVTAAGTDNAEMNWIRDCQKQLATEPKFGRISWICSLIRMRYGDVVGD